MNQTASVEAVLARAEDGRFKEVEHLVRIDSATSRLQLAHGVASARQRIADGGRNAPDLRERLGIPLP